MTTMRRFHSSCNGMVHGSDDHNFPTGIMPEMTDLSRLRKRPPKPMRRRAPAPLTRSISPAARRSLTLPRIRLTRSSTTCDLAARPRGRRGDARAYPGSAVGSLGGRRRSYRQILVQEYTFSPGEPPASTQNSALISARLTISVSRLFRTRTARARRRLRPPPFCVNGSGSRF
jgi:hypothetical protein